MEYAIIVAGGKGLRMGADLPKQFLPVGGKPVLMRTMEAFYAYSREIRIVLVLPHDQQRYWQRLCREHGFILPHSVADGGETRFHSVRNGLRLVEAPALVAVHDGVRPFASVATIRACYEAARLSGAAIPVTPVVETLRHAGGHTVPRSDYRLVQTPQAFSLDVLRRAYAQPYRDAFTDDASVVEAAGHEVTLVEGNRENIKITTPFDLAVAEAVLSQQAEGRPAHSRT